MPTVGELPRIRHLRGLVGDVVQRRLLARGELQRGREYRNMDGISSKTAVFVIHPRETKETPLDRLLLEPYQLGFPALLTPILDGYQGCLEVEV